MPRRYQRSRDVPKSKRLANRPYATKGHKLQHLEGGLITRKHLPNGDTLVTAIHEDGTKTEHIEGDPHAHR